MMDWIIPVRAWTCCVRLKNASGKIAGCIVPLPGDGFASRSSGRLPKPGWHSSPPPRRDHDLQKMFESSGGSFQLGSSSSIKCARVGHPHNPNLPRGGCDGQMALLLDPQATFPSLGWQLINSSSSRPCPVEEA
ncbi:hypothetical protein BHE74_00051915 [Ensete ventricosum]|nr:hypothetical protein BHE74_00051915 [Ensete ventricosum]